MKRLNGWDAWLLYSETPNRGRRTEHHAGGADGQRHGGAERPRRAAAERRQQQCPRVACASQQTRPNTPASHQKFDRTFEFPCIIHRFTDNWATGTDRHRT